MKVIAHRGGMGRGRQNSPAGVRLAVLRGADFVELDVLPDGAGGFSCKHGWGQGVAFADCLVELAPGMGLVAHLKGNYQEEDLRNLIEQIANVIPLEKVLFGSHGMSVLRRLREIDPEAKLARFGFLPALVALWKQQPWDCCMVNSLVLRKWHVQALQRRGYQVIASCVWEWRSRQTVRELGVDGAFVNLRK